MDLVKDIKLSEDEIMISFDVKSLFTNVPITEAVEVIHGMLKTDGRLWKNKQFYHQTGLQSI